MKEYPLKHMRSAIIKITSYFALTIGAVLIAGCLYAIAQTEYAISAAFGQFVNSSLSTTKGLSGIPQAGDFADLARRGFSAFTDEALSKMVARTEGRFVFNEIISNSAGAIAYAELSNCAGLTRLYKNEQPPQCAWDYSVKILHPKNNSTVTVYSSAGNETNLAGTLQIPVPYAWTKGDKGLILVTRQIGGARNKIFVPEYSVANLSSGIITKLGEGVAFFLDDYAKAIVVNDTEARGMCHSYGGNAGKIAVVETETGKSATVAEEEDIVYQLISYDRAKGNLTYGYQADGVYAICDYADSANLPKKTVSVKP